MDSPLRPFASSKRKRPHENHRRTNIVIPLHRKPPDYIPGSGPALQRIRLLPLQDSTAYILDRILLPSPGLAKDGKPLPKIMAYLVGWHDLPAARMMIPAMQVLEYVSPRALEEWEEQMEQELDMERAKLEEDAKKTLVEARATKKRGRPPKHTQIEAAVVAAPEPEGKAAAWQKEGVMSITTPKKAHREGFRLEAGEGSEDEEATPSRQLERELLGELHMAVDSGAISEVEMIDVPEASEGISLLATESDGSSMNQSTTRYPENKRANENAHANPLVAPSQTKDFSGFSLRPSPGPSTAASSARPRVTVAAASPLRNKAAQANVNGVGHVVQHWTSFAPAGSTPLRSPLAFEALDPMTQMEVVLPLETASSKPKPSGRPEKKDKTPKQKAPKQKVPKQKTPKQKMPKDEPSQTPLDDGNSEPVWEVKRLEDYELYDVEGRGLVRYFKVLWEGDWPPEQNPSWEPEENLPAALVRNFLKRPKKKQPRPASKKQKKLKQTTLAWANGKQYKSVSEAFAGGAEDIGIDSTQMDQAEDNTGDEQEELFVVEEPERNQPRPSWAAALGSRSMELGMVSMHR